MTEGKNPQRIANLDAFAAANEVATMSAMRRLPKSVRWLFAFAWIAVASTAMPAATAAQSDDVKQSRNAGRHALIVVGLSGDESHRAAFQKTVEAWTDFLTSRAGFTSDNITLLFGREGLDEAKPATQEHVRSAVEQLVARCDAGDAVWVFLLGHGSQDTTHSWFHLPGPDMHEADWAGLFAGLKSDEQVFWLTQAASGGFVKAMSRPGRVVIAATAATGEVNETQFSTSLAKMMQSPASDLDSNGDSQVSLVELFRATTTSVAMYFEDNSLAPTEHAQLDDNGDGQGSEVEQLLPEESPNDDGAEATAGSNAATTLDGAKAARLTVERIEN